MAANDIVVGVDGSEGGALALQWAAEEAEARNWRLVPVLVWHYLEQHHADGVDRFDPDYDEASALATLRHHVEAALGSRSQRAELRVVCDRPAPGLLDAASGAALLVVGARGLGGFKGLVLGSVSQHCLHHATVPVAVVHEVAGIPTRGRVMVGVDGSPNGTAALRWALEQARAMGARVDLVHVWHMAYVGGEPWVFTVPIYEDCRKAAELRLDRVLDGIDLTGVDAERRVVEGAGGAVLVQASVGASLVVVGARGLGGFAGLLLGSVSNQVARHAHCPVVVVPGGDAT